MWTRRESGWCKTRKMLEASGKESSHGQSVLFPKQLLPTLCLHREVACTILNEIKLYVSHFYCFDKSNDLGQKHLFEGPAYTCCSDEVALMCNQSLEDQRRRPRQNKDDQNNNQHPHDLKTGSNATNWVHHHQSDQEVGKKQVMHRPQFVVSTRFPLPCDQSLSFRSLQSCHHYWINIYETKNVMWRKCLCHERDWVHVLSELCQRK